MVLRNVLKRAVSALAVAALAACAGGGGSGSSPGGGSLPATPTPTPGSTPAATTVTATLTIGGSSDDAVRRITAHRAQMATRAGQHPDYVSPGSMGVTIVADIHGTPTVASSQAFDVSPGSPLCTAGVPRTCTLAITVSPGDFDFTLTIFNEAPVSGAIPGGALSLGVSTLTQTINPGTANNLAFTVQGVVSGITTTGGVTFGSLPANGVTQQYGITLVVTDAAGDTVTGSNPYSNPVSVSLAESGGSGHAVLIHNGSASGTSATVTSPTDTLAVQYDGGGTSGYTSLTTLSAAGASSATVRVSPLYISGALAFTDQAQGQTISATEANAPGTIGYTTTWTCTGFSKSASGSGPSWSATITSPSLTVGAAPPSFACPATVTVTDSLGSSLNTSYSGSLPTSTSCASIGSGKYIGGAAPYRLANGTPCALNVAGTSVIVYNPSDGTHPASAALPVTEANDTTAPSVDASACNASNIAATNGMTPGAAPNASLGGNLNVATNASGALFYGCNVIVHDNNGQSVTVNAIVDANSLTSSGGGTWNAGGSCFSVPFCAGTWAYTGYSALYSDTFTAPPEAPLEFLTTGTAPTSAANELQFSITATSFPTNTGTGGCTPAANVATGHLYYINETGVWSVVSEAIVPLNGSVNTWSSPTALPGTYILGIAVTDASCGVATPTSAFDMGGPYTASITQL